jgi:xanthine dehydrogenase accessory factor
MVVLASRDGHEWSYGPDGGRRVEHVEPAPRLVVAGAGDVAAELLRHGRALGWRTTLLDPRAAFVEQTLRDAPADEVVAAWPDDAAEQLALDARCACVAAAHVGRIDEPFLELALQSPAFYVGSIGSRVVQRARTEALATRLDEAQVARHHGPAGLDLGGGDAAEIALSIIAEVVAASNGRTGGPLRSSPDPIRARP